MTMHVRRQSRVVIASLKFGKICDALNALVCCAVRHAVEQQGKRSCDMAIHNDTS